MNYQNLDKKLQNLYTNYLNMKKIYYFQNLHKFNPDMFFDKLYEKCFDSVNEFEEFTYTILEFEQENLQNITDVLQYLLSVAIKYDNQKKKKSFIYDDDYFIV